MSIDVKMLVSVAADVGIGRGSCILYLLQSVSKIFKFELMSHNCGPSSIWCSFVDRCPSVTVGRYVVASVDRY
ncbi:hypothetical protein DY000_02010126 [Brassica cretica]|uniref:Uncharacterized protein n=1 Tax=Brassica cretica TaxID=69181 RepID=A0ABQ7CBV9_BRACR|nr:hypothetical protein DY000_02010126 [Brassica cretica]